MSSDLPTVWRADPHTFAKHKILEQYLKAWFPILSHQANRVGREAEIHYIDGFAGPGRYADGSPGSPVIALETALEFTGRLPVPIRLVFIEEAPERLEHLQGVLSEFEEKIRAASHIRLTPPRLGDCESVLSDILDKHEQTRRRFGPALAFLDQFGYSAVPMDLIRRILAYGQCEVLLYLDFRGMNRWISDDTKASSFARAYGGDEWREARALPEERRRTALLDSYKACLHSRAKAAYTCSFSMFDRRDRPIYWLVFATNNLRGLEVMKRAMWKVDETGEFRFSDCDEPSQLDLLDKSFSQEWLAEHLRKKLAGTTRTVAQIKEYVLVNTPCYRYKDALKLLEGDSDKPIEVLKAPARRRRGTFPDDWESTMQVRFSKSLF